MPQRRQYDEEGNLINAANQVQWFGGLDPNDPNWGTAGGFGTAGGRENDSQYLVGPEGALGGGLTGAEPRTSFQGPDGRWYNRVGMPPPPEATAEDLRNYTFDPQYGWGIETNYAEQLSAASEDKLFGLVTPAQAIQGAIGAFTGAAMGGLLPGGTPIWGGGIPGGGSELLNATDTAAIDAAGMGPGGNLGGGLGEFGDVAMDLGGSVLPDGGISNLPTNDGSVADFPDEWGMETGGDIPGGLPGGDVLNPGGDITDGNVDNFPDDWGMEDVPIPGGGDEWWRNLLPGGGGGGGGGLNDLLRGLIGGAGSYYSSKELADELGRISDRNFSIGEPYRALNLASYQPGFDLYNQPGYGDALNRSAEVATRQWNPAGNPANNPGIQGNILNDVWTGSYLPALNSYRGGLLGSGSMGLADSTQTALAAVNARNQGWGGVGYGLNTAMGGGSNPFNSGAMGGINSLTNAGASLLDYFGNQGNDSAPGQPRRRMSV